VITNIINESKEKPNIIVKRTKEKIHPEVIKKTEKKKEEPKPEKGKEPKEKKEDEKQKN